MGCNMGLVKKILSVLAACVMIICAASCFYHYDYYYDGSAKIGTGRAPDGTWRGDKHDRDYIYNYAFFCSFSLLAFGIISLIFAIIEILLLIPSLEKYVSFASSGLMRAIIYILMGIAILGTSYDLGVAAGSMAIIVGGIMLIIEIVGLVMH